MANDKYTSLLTDKIRNYFLSKKQVVIDPCNLIIIIIAINSRITVFCSCDARMASQQCMWKCESVGM